MDYEMMVKEAYEEIMGIEKEAANGLGGAADYAKKVGLGGAADYAKKVGLGGAADLRGGLNKVLHTPIAAGQYAKKMATYDSDVQFEKEAGSYASALGHVQKSAVRRIAESPNRDSILSRLKDGYSRFSNQADSLATRHEKLQNAWRDNQSNLVLRKKYVEATDQLKNLQGKARNIEYMMTRINNHTGK